MMFLIKMDGYQNCVTRTRMWLKWGWLYTSLLYNDCKSCLLLFPFLIGCWFIFYCEILYWNLDYAISIGKRMVV